MDRDKVEEYLNVSPFVYRFVTCLNAAVVGHLYVKHCSGRNQLAKVTVFGTQIVTDIMYILV